MQAASHGSRTTNEAICKDKGSAASRINWAKANTIATASANHQKSARVVVPVKSRPRCRPSRMVSVAARLGAGLLASRLSAETSEAAASARKDSVETFAPDSRR